ncbi:MAG TPA: sugar phosphate nucleotidyltransferase [Nitrospinaceae bacterium]|jgi:mannose-1-phosphate guanylyltransferase|nr:sugar phosphate nucleotidyltransferase [Nitrospinaceae bacterium]
MSIEKRRCLESVDVVILAGGLGTRVSGVLGDTPKVLAPISGRPYLEYLFDFLLFFGARRIILLLGHLASAVDAYLANREADALAVEMVVEVEPKGTAGALRDVTGSLRSDPVMVLNGDSFINTDFCDFVSSHSDSGAEGSILCVVVDEVERYGQVKIRSDGRIKEFSEKNPSAEGKGVINAGVYLMSRALLDQIKGMPGSSLEKDIFATLPVGTLYGHVVSAPFIDIGTPSTLARAQEVPAGVFCGKF